MGCCTLPQAVIASYWYLESIAEKPSDLECEGVVTYENESKDPTKVPKAAEPSAGHAWLTQCN